MSSQKNMLNQFFENKLFEKNSLGNVEVISDFNADTIAGAKVGFASNFN